jgi:hypothetical protein
MFVNHLKLPEVLFKACRKMLAGLLQWFLPFVRDLVGRI